jgi:thymidylate synthase
MNQYLDLLRHVRDNGNTKTDRTGTGTRSIFGAQMRFDLSKGFPAVTTKKLFFKSVATELIWLLRGDTNIAFLKRHDCSIWNAWAHPETGELGPTYGAQWRAWPNPDGSVTDQIANVIHSLKTNPDSRRHIVSAWNVPFIEQMALPPCHCLFQFEVHDNKLSCSLYQRSADLFLGVPFNIASYALLTNMLAKHCGYEVGDFIHSFGDVHIYLNHLEQVNEQLSRSPRTLPELRMADRAELWDYEPGDFSLLNYDHHPALRAPISV